MLKKGENREFSGGKEYDFKRKSNGIIKSHAAG